ncbi:MAG: hypothetical protein KBT34_05490 [Prevotella sp.]|nr:hypothetical protein [Candidatus Prevotella equi]
MTLYMTYFSEEIENAKYFISRENAFHYLTKGEGRKKMYDEYRNDALPEIYDMAELTIAEQQTLIDSFAVEVINNSEIHYTSTDLDGKKELYSAAYIEEIHTED